MKHKQEKQKLSAEMRNQFLVDRWTKVYIPLAAKAKGRFARDAREVDKYFKSDHGSFYDELSGDGTDDGVAILGGSGLFRMTVNLMAQVRGYIGPHLYAKHPIRTVTARTRDSVAAWLATVGKVYLNATPYETELKEEIRDAIDDALLPGRGVGVLAKEDGIVTTRHEDVGCLYIDPDARCLKEAKWIAIRCCEPLFEVKREYKTGNADDPTRGLKPNAKSFSEADHGDAKNMVGMLDLESRRFQGQTTDLLVYYKVWSKMGSGLLFGKSGPHEGSESHDFTREKGNRFRYLVVAPGHAQPLRESDWPVPIHLDRDWPVEILDFTPTRKGDEDDPLWPVSLMRLALPQQKAINMLTTILVNDLKQRARMIMGVLGDQAEKIKSVIVSGELHAAFNLNPEDGAVDVRQIAQLLDLGQTNPMLMQEIERQERKFGEITGLLPILKGVTIGHGDQQMRSAMEASVRDRNSRSRVEDMGERVESFNSRCARKEFLAMRLACTPKEVERVVLDQLPPAPWKVQVMLGQDVLTTYELRDLVPWAGHYFPSEEVAKKAQEQLVQVAESMLRPAWQIENPTEPWIFNTVVREVTLEELWFDTAGRDAGDLAGDFKVQIEAGSARRKDHTMERDQVTFMLGEVGQRAAALGQWDVYNAVLNEVYDVMQRPEHTRQFLDVERLNQMQVEAAQEAEQNAAQDHMRKAQLEVAKTDVKERGAAQRIVLKGSVDQALQQDRFAHEKAIDVPGGGGWG